MDKYIIVSSNSTSVLVEKVNKIMKMNNYVPEGGLAPAEDPIYGIVFYQVLVMR